ncbi:hypothetical protein EVAR_24012_1 [Eumeta japonica]|uniref:Uncharacterized protein n=1 Tax=Eumeta variegata TaxID=151549 RepID=A0A4C1WBA5_EUMVA|nr:hypothetical protein EVAR_24012_1 [Eumeta japonica]
MNSGVTPKWVASSRPPSPSYATSYICLYYRITEHLWLTRIRAAAETTTSSQYIMSTATRQQRRSRERRMCTTAAYCPGCRENMPTVFRVLHPRGM